MKKFTKLAIAVALATGITFGVQALEITPDTLPQITGNQTSQNEINGVIDDYIGTPLKDYLMYKQDVGGGESGPLAGSYQTTFNNSPLDPSDALIQYVGGLNVGPTAWLLVKDGNQSPAWYLFNLTTLGWNGTDDLKLTGFWPAQGAISHVTLYGTAVPDGGTTMALLGLGIGAVGYLRRKLA